MYNAETVPGENDMWKYFNHQYIGIFCSARGLRFETIKAYSESLNRFKEYVISVLKGKSPNELTTMEMLCYANYLEKVRENGPSAINRQMTIVRHFYRGLVSMGVIKNDENPMFNMPIRRQPPTKVPRSIAQEDILKMMNQTDLETTLGIRDKALMVLLYGTGIRKGECHGLDNKDVDFTDKKVYVTGKGGNERSVPMTEEVMLHLKNYVLVRGVGNADEPFFISRNKTRMAKRTIYERIKQYGKKAGLQVNVSPHKLRHSFATHLVRKGERIQDVQALLGHKWITSTQIYYHTDSVEIRKVLENHPIKNLISDVQKLLPNTKLPFQNRNRGMFGGT